MRRRESMMRFVVFGSRLILFRCTFSPWLPNGGLAAAAVYALVHGC
jgi:hypothetical protein